MQKQWHVQCPDPQQQVLLSDELDIHPIIAQLLINRGIVDIQEARQFLKASLDQLHDPFLMKGMPEAVERIKAAQIKKERVLIFGDYDVDGVTSAAMLNRGFEELGLDVEHQIPHRMSDGYGLNSNVAVFAKAKQIQLVITIDCGVTAIDEVQAIRDAGIDVIVIDHHEPSEAGLPNANVIVDPKQRDCLYPFKELASVGLAFKVLHALKGDIDPDMLDLAALGTVADVVPLRGENRILVKAGLAHIQKTKKEGLKALLEVAKIKGKVLTPFHIGFVLGPRINAAGRMESAHTALDLFLTCNPQEAKHLAQTLDRYNRTRQRTQREAIDEAVQLVESQVNFKEEKVIVLHKEDWHKGVIGIIASRLTDKYFRPSIVISVQDGVGTASCRSIAGFHIQEALEQCREWLENYGGHEGAAGLTIKKENIDPFRKLINDVAQEQIEIRALTPSVRIDCDIPLSAISLALADIINTLQPFGEGNPMPLFSSRKAEVLSYPQILGRETLKFWVGAEEVRVSIVGFGMAKCAEMIRPGAFVDVVYEIGIDDWNKAPEPQLILKDIKLSEEIDHDPLTNQGQKIITHL